MDYLIPCCCGRNLPVTEAMAGTSVRCECGQMHPVPALRKLREAALGTQDVADVSVPVETRERLYPAAKLTFIIVLVFLALLQSLALAGVVHNYAFMRVPLLAMTGGLLIIWGNFWLVLQIYEGNLLAALLILAVPVLSIALILNFVRDHWKTARWPFLMELCGVLVLIVEIPLRVLTR